MTKTIFIPVFVALTMVMMSLAFTASAQCTTCGTQEDWDATATSFLEGKSVNDTPPLWGPKAERLTNSQFESKANASENNSTQEMAESSTEMATAGIDLKSIKAEPSSVKSGDPVMITAVFTENGSGSASNQALLDYTSSDNEASLTAAAIIRDSSGAEVGKVNLMPSSGDTYYGVWDANVTEGFYKATIAASSLQASNTFDDALQIEVGYGNAADQSPAGKDLG